VTIRLYDTLTDRKVDFEPLEPGHVRMYVCGPTVYEMSHLGHARCYSVWDTVVRWFEASGLRVTVARNYTDVDDRIIKRANDEGVSWKDVAERFIKEYETDMAALGVRDTTHKPRAMDHIEGMQEIIRKLIERDLAYPSAGDVYFAVRKFPGYLKLSHRQIDELLAGARVEPGEQKRDPLDFALWKGAKPGEPFWDSPWGPGRPGWHIECSAMSAKYLGETFDIHSGGRDLIFPHHENEIAQSEGANGKTFARYWMHNGFLNIDKEKMSKSLGNFFTIRDLTERFEGEALRYALLQTHYRHPLDFSERALADADARVEYFYETLAKVEQGLGATSWREAAPLDDEMAAFREAMDDDFNTAEAMGGLSALFTRLNEWAEKPSRNRETLARGRRTADRLGWTLGLLQKEPRAFLDGRRDRLARQRGVDAGEIARQLDARAEARRAKDFARADAIRKELLARGIEVMDGPAGSTWKFASS
jgi:cysteinyl-tRNA synthetase